MGTRTGRASVDVVADVGKFGSDLSNGLDKAAKQTKVDLSPVAKKMAADIDKGVKQAEKAVMRLDSVKVGDGITQGTDKAATSLKQLGTTASQSIKGIETDSASVGSKIGQGIGKGVDTARTALRSIGSGLDTAVKGVQSSLNKIKSGLKGVGEDSRKAAAAAGDGFGKLEATLAGVGLAAGAALTDGIMEGLQRSKLNGVLAAQIGAAPADAARIGALSGQLFAQGFGEDVSEVNDALRSAFQSGLVSVRKSTDSTVAAVTKRLMTVSQVLGEDTQRTSIAIQQMLRTGLAKNAQQAMDLLVSATQRGVNKSEDLLDTVNEYGTQFRQLGLDGPRAFGLLSQAIGAGARDADTAADALKEFAIRAIDGSASSTAAYEALGLSAETMTNKIAQGGSKASEGLAVVLDKLRFMKDPVERNTIAVGLFGTKAEDLGQALYAMDVDTATKALEGFGGAADRAGNTISQTAGAQLEVFTRKLKGELITNLAAAGTHIMENASAYQVLGTSLLAIAGTVATVSAVTKAWAAAQIIATVATKAWAVANKILSLSLLGTPLGWILLAVGLLVAGLVLAYQKSDTFRNIVQTALKAVGAAGMWLWNNALKPAFDGIVVAVKWLGDAFVWLWNTIIKPYYTFWGNIALWLWNTVIVPAWNGIVAATRVLGAIFTWLWTNIVSPYFKFIGTLALWLWNNIIVPAWNGIVIYTKILGAIFGWLYSVFGPPIKAIAGLVFWIWKQVFLLAWDGVKMAFRGLAVVISWWWTSIVSPTFRAVGALASWLWRNVIVPAFNGIKAAIQVVGAAARGLWTGYISPAFKAISSAVRSLYNSYILPIFNSIRSTIQNRIREAVSVAGSVASFVSRVSANFTNLINAVRSRLNTVVSTVRSLPGRIGGAIGNLGGLLYNAGRNVIQGLINGIASKLGALRAKASAAASTIRNLFPFSPAKEGPLSGRGSPEIAGAKIASMVATGMQKNTPKLYRAAYGMAQATMGGPARGGLDYAGQGILRTTLGAQRGGALTPPDRQVSRPLLGAGAVQVNFVGVVPTAAEAQRTGEAVGAGIASTLTSRNVTNTVRTL